MNTEFYAFGEILWDCLPAGRHAGGAPFNVAAHLAQLGGAASLISAIGQDALGDELLAVAQGKGVNIELVGRGHVGLPTGTVSVAVNAAGDATYEIAQPAAWDEIQVSSGALQAVSQARGLVFGSLAGRAPHNLKQLSQLLALPGPTRFFDVNLRPPYDDLPLVTALAKRADVLKVNDDELARLVSFTTADGTASPRIRSPEALAKACAQLAEATDTPRICVTRAADGAALWERGELICASAPAVTVRDTVGAGDSFMAAFMIGLTRGMEGQRLLDAACRVGAFVASQDGAIPRLPPELVQEFRCR